MHAQRLLVKPITLQSFLGVSKESGIRFLKSRVKVNCLSFFRSRQNMKLLHVVGARPNFPKLAPVHRAAKKRGLEQIIVHTGQHYDESLSETFFRSLEIPAPTYNLEVGSASHAVQTAMIMQRLEPIFVETRPNWIMVYGDVNSTLAAALVASKLGILAAHVESGLRSYDRRMPEEINRMVVDRISDLLLTPSTEASTTLLNEGEAPSKIAFVGNVMIDSLFYSLPLARQTEHLKCLNVEPHVAVIVTLHRPSNVDDSARLKKIAVALREIATERPVLFSVHPRTQLQIEKGKIDLSGVRLLPPLGYLEMLCLIDGAFAVVTDSGGIQEETTALGVPCFTVRDTTERPITITQGTNLLVPDPAILPASVRNAKRTTCPSRPDGWDGSAGPRIIDALFSFSAV